MMYIYKQFYYFQNTPSPATYEVSESFNKSHGKKYVHIERLIIMLVYITGKGYTRSRHTGFLSQPNRFGGPIKFLDESTRENPGIKIIHT